MPERKGTKDKERTKKETNSGNAVHANPCTSKTKIKTDSIP